MRFLAFLSFFANCALRMFDQACPLSWGDDGHGHDGQYGTSFSVSKFDMRDNLLTENLTNG